MEKTSGLQSGLNAGVARRVSEESKSQVTKYDTKIGEDQGVEEPKSETQSKQELPRPNTNTLNQQLANQFREYQQEAVRTIAEY
jgi:hypothetical protein